MDISNSDSEQLQYDESKEMASTEMRRGESIEIVDNDDGDGDVRGESEPEVADPDADLHLFEDDSVQGFFAHTDAVYAVSCSPIDPNDVVTGGGDDRAYRWNVGTGDQHPAAALVQHGDSVVSVGFSHDAAMFATAGMDGVVRVYGTADSALLHTLDGPASEIEWMAWHPKGPALAVGCSDGTGWVWHVSQSRSHLLQVVSQDSSQVCGGFTGKWLCSGSQDGTLRAWSVKEGGAPVTVIKSGPLYHQGPITTLDTHPTQPIVITGSQDQTARWVHIESGKILGAITDHGAAVEAVAFPSPDLPHNWAATGAMDGAGFIVDLDRGGAIRARFSHDDGIVRLKWLKKRPYLLCSCSLDGSVKLWDSRTGTCVQEFRGHTGPVYDIAVSADERFLVSCSDDHTALVFSINHE